MPNEGSMSKILQSVVDQNESDYKGERLYEPIPPGDFFLSERHCGMPRQMIPRFWLDKAVEFIEGDYNEMIITGGLGAFKTTWANLIQMYKTYELFSWRDIHTYLGIPAVQDVYSVYFSVALQQAKLTGYKQYKALLDQSDWFKHNFPRNTSLNSIIEFPKNSKYAMLLGSGEQHAIGMTIWSFILDEGDFFKKNSKAFDDSHEQAASMYNELIDRRMSRFQKLGKDFSFSILISSATFQSSFVSKRIEEALSDEKDRTMVVRAVRYKIEADKYSSETFLVFAGDAILEPEIVETHESLQSILQSMKSDYKVREDLSVRENYERLPDIIKDKFETPPVDLKDRFRKDPHRSLMNFSGVAVAQIGKLLQSKAILRQCYTESLQHPFSKEKIELSTGDDIQLKEYFVAGLLDFPERPHALHVDGSVTGDSTGISMVRYDGLHYDNNGNALKRYTQVFSLEILPPPAPYRIKLSKIRDFIVFLRKEVGVNIIKSTYDQYQSEDSIQLLNEQGVPAARRSVDKNDEPYFTWISLMVDQVIRHYEYKVLEDEAFAAIHDRKKRKVDHPKTGDININVLQSFVGALQNLVDSEDAGFVSESPEVQVNTGRKRKEDEAKKLVRSGTYTSNIMGALNERKKRENAVDIILGN